MKTLALRLCVFALGVASVAGLAGQRTFAAFSSSTANPGDSFAAGTVVIGDNDLGNFMLAITNAKPTLAGDTDTSCIELKTTGTLDSTVRLYATVAGALAQYLTLTVTRGTSTTGFDNCTGFTADGTNYIGAGNGVVWTGKLSTFPTSYASGIVDPTSGSPATWQNLTIHVYKFVVSLDDNTAAQGLSGSADFTWEARNL